MIPSSLIRTAALAVRLASLLNIALALGILCLFGASLLLGTVFTAALLGAQQAADLPSLTAAARATMVFGLATSAATYVLLRALGRMIASVRAGDPFIEANAARLRTIGWSLLALQLTDLPALLIRHLWPLAGFTPSASFSAGGWLAVLVAFVLARIFTAGAAMRDDLEGTV